MCKFFESLKDQMVVPVDPYPDEASKACPPDSGFPIDGIITSEELAAKALLTGAPLLGCKVFNGARLEIGDVEVLRGKSLLSLFLDRYRNLDLVNIKIANGDINKDAARFFNSHELVVADLYGCIKLENMHYPEVDCPMGIPAILE